MYTRDGICLDADVYTPDESGEFPVLLMRQPYGRKIASTVVYAHPRWYAARGYIVAIQDVRGRGTSEGEFELFTREGEDGEDAVNWAAQLPQSSGVVGMYGFSYQGMTQLYAAQHQPPALKALCPAMLAYDLYQDWAYENGAFCLQGNLGWAVQLAAETARLKGDATAYKVLYSASGDLPFYDSSPRFKESLNKYAPSNFYQQWLHHPNPQDPYWQQFTPDLSRVDLPMFHIGGWFDSYLRGTLRLYRYSLTHCKAAQRLLIGPWGHLPWCRRVGALDYGAEAASPVDELQIRWFDYHLKGRDTGELAQPPVRLFIMGRNQWQDFEQLPQLSPQVYYCHSNGLANLREDGGQLLTTPPDTLQQDSLVHDPWRPVPALGGHAASPAGSFERSALDGRSDVITYTTPPLSQGCHIVGEGRVLIYWETDGESFDLCAILSEVRPDGTVYNITQGYKRITQPAASPLEIPLQETACFVPEGYGLRLSISGACFPAYPVNSGQGEGRGIPEFMDGQIITLHILSGLDTPSRVILPLAHRREAPHWGSSCL
ncbi:CocE/NonD family hydrolase [Spirulina subsalsa]|uniref:CocE/NonD family hydrolase n=1 Tax=Spirulina subsalsa TaxID=54311 RepID=UPI0002F7EE48|nr:CocE/NonD family hydrolase [Spirulina subsalsa]